MKRISFSFSLLRYGPGIGATNAFMWRNFLSFEGIETTPTHDYIRWVFIELRKLQFFHLFNYFCFQSSKCFLAICRVISFTAAYWANEYWVNVYVGIKLFDQFQHFRFLFNAIIVIRTYVFLNFIIGIEWGSWWKVCLINCWKVFLRYEVIFGNVPYFMAHS